MQTNPRPLKGNIQLQPGNTPPEPSQLESALPTQMDPPPSLESNGKSENTSADTRLLDVSSLVQSTPSPLRTKTQTKRFETFADFIYNGHFASDKDDDDDDSLCNICGSKNTLDDVTQWVACDVCEKWFHCKCVKIPPPKANYVKHYKCSSCTTKRADYKHSADFASDEDEESDDALCDICRGKNNSEDNTSEDVTQWVACDFCQKWFHCKCVKITPAKAKHLKHFKCPFCTTNKALLRLF